MGYMPIFYARITIASFILRGPVIYLLLLSFPNREVPCWLLFMGIRHRNDCGSRTGLRDTDEAKRATRSGFV